MYTRAHTRAAGGAREVRTHFATGRLDTAAGRGGRSTGRRGRSGGRVGVGVASELGSGSYPDRGSALG